MKRASKAALSGLIFNLLATVAWAGSSPEQTQTATTRIAGQDIPVVAGGLYDRYSSNPPLAVIAAEAPDIDLSWFKTLEKSKVDMGFESYSPNFYYRNSRVTAVFTADLQRLRELMPAQVLEQVQPLQIWPGRGLVALTAYAYEYCDNDSYNEVALSIVTNKPGNANLGPLTLLGQSMTSDFWGYVLQLPVNTRLAEIRGVVGYNLPKWTTEIHFSESDAAVHFEILDSETGERDLLLETDKLDELSRDIEMVANSFTNIGHDGELTYGHAISRQLRHASSSDGARVRLHLGEGPLARLLRSLDLGKMMKYEYVPEFQSALYAPEPLAALLRD